jgi:hypothetical protein
MISLYPCLSHYFLQEYYFWFVPAFSATQVRHKSRSSCATSRNILNFQADWEHKIGSCAVTASHSFMPSDNIRLAVVLTATFCTSLLTDYICWTECQFCYCMKFWYSWQDHSCKRQILNAFHKWIQKNLCGVPVNVRQSGLQDICLCWLCINCKHYRIAELVLCYLHILWKLSLSHFKLQLCRNVMQYQMFWFTRSM